METTVNQRLKILIEHLNSNPERFAKTVGVSGAAIRKIVSGDSEPGATLTRSILSKHTDISADWFILGEGDMLRNETIVANSLTEQIVAELKNELKWQRSLIDRLLNGKQTDLAKLTGNNETLRVYKLAV